MVGMVFGWRELLRCSSLGVFGGGDLILDSRGNQGRVTYFFSLVGWPVASGEEDMKASVV